MASVFGHGIVAITISKVFNSKNGKWLLILAICSAIIPDIDVLAFEFGIPYSHPLGHRGFTHSILLAIIWAFCMAFNIGRKSKSVWFFVIFLSTISHGILDAMTSGGRGVGFFIPFNNERLFLPFRKIVVSPIRIHEFFSEWGLQVILSEIKYVLVPCGIILLVTLILRKLYK